MRLSPGRAPLSGSSGMAEDPFVIPSPPEDPPVSPLLWFTESRQGQWTVRGGRLTSFIHSLNIPKSDDYL